VSLYADGVDVLVDATRQAVVQRGKRLEYFTIAWNSLEGVCYCCGCDCGEHLACGVWNRQLYRSHIGRNALWRMHVDSDAPKRERNEHLSLRIVGVCFVALAIYVAYEAVTDLIGRKAPEHSLPGIVLVCVSLIVMPVLSRAKKQVGKALGSIAMRADAKQTDFCVYLSAILLAGLLLNVALGWWWADPFAGLVMTPIIAKEGVAGIKGEACCDECR